MEERGSQEPCYIQKIHCSKLGAGTTVAPHWLSCEHLSLAGLLLGAGKVSLSSSCCDRKVVSTCKVQHFPLGLQLTMSGRA